MSDENKQIARRFIEDGIVNGDAITFEETVAENVVAHFLSPGRPPGLAGIMQAADSWRSAFPDTQPGIEHAVAEGDLVVLRGVSSFTHKGEFMGIPRPGRRSQLSGLTCTASRTARSSKCGPSRTSRGCSSS